MGNEILWFLFAIVNFTLIVLAYKFFGKTGLFAWIALGTILANIQVTKTIDFTFFGFTFVATLGNIMYGTLFLVTDSLDEKYGLKDAKKAVYIGFFSLLATVIVMQFAIWFTPNIDDWANDSIITIFGILPRIALGSLTAYLISQMVDVHLYQLIRKKLPEDKFLWIRNNGSTLVSQFVDTVIFVPIAFLGEWPIDVVLSIFITSYLIKVLVAFLDTPFVYLIKKIKPLDEN